MTLKIAQLFMRHTPTQALKRPLYIPHWAISDAIVEVAKQDGQSFSPWMVKKALEDPRVEKLAVQFAATGERSK